MVPTTSCYLIFLALLLPINLVAGECTCDKADITKDKGILSYKVGAIITILVSSAIGVTIPILGKNIPALHPDRSLFFLIKSFAAGVILSTGFIHILPDAFDSLTSPCLKESPWGKFPFAGLAAMVGSLGTLMIDSLATGHFHKAHFGNQSASVVDEENTGEHAGHVHLHTHATHGHSHGPAASALVPQKGLSELDRMRYKVTSQVNETPSSANIYT